VCLVFGFKAWQRPRLYVGTALAGYIAGWTIGWQRWPLPEFNQWLALVTALILIVIAWRFRLPTALLPLLLGLYPVMKIVLSFGVQGWGILLITVAFMTLIIGIAINWGLRHLQPEKKADDALPT
jgi:hypothetical protein